LSNFQLVSSFVLGGLLRGLIVGILPLLIAMPMVGLRVDHWPLVVLVLALTSVFFSCLGIISALWSEGWDNIATFTNFVVTPFVYLGGVFYSIHMLPGFWQKVSMANPIFYLVDALRHAVLGISDVPWAVSLGILCAMAGGSFLFCVYLFRIGYKLVK
jgi:ABC-2 type transport system permease protein